MAQFYYYPPVGNSTLPPGAATSANQVLEIALLTSIDSKSATLGQKTMAGSEPVVIASDQSAIAVTGPLTDAQLRATAVPVSAASLPLPTGASTAANQTTELASLASIDSKLTSPLTVTGPLTDAQLRATAVPVSMASSPLPTGAATEATLLAFSNKTASAAVSEDFDYQAITYVGATTDISTVVYKTGGSSGTTVATLTMGYDGSNRLTSVTKT